MVTVVSPPGENNTRHVGGFVMADDLANDRGVHQRNITGFALNRIA